MNNLLQNAVATAIGGVVVAAVSYYVFSEHAPRSNVELTRYAVSYDANLLRTIQDDARDVAKKALEQGGISRDDLEDVLRYYPINYLSNDFVFGADGIIETIEVRNGNSDRSTTILVEGVDDYFTIIRSETEGSNKIIGKFSRDVRILPNETISIFHVSKFGGSFISRRENSSNSIKVSSDQVYLTAQNTPSLLNEIFGNSIARYPFAYFMLIVIGAVTLILFLVGMLISFFTGKPRARIVEENPNTDGS